MCLLWWLICAMSYKHVFGAKSRKIATRKPAKWCIFSCFRMATFHPATRKYATFHAYRFRLLFVVSLPGGAKGRHAKTRQNHHLAVFFAWRPFAFSPRKHAYTTWHKSATIVYWGIIETKANIQGRFTVLS